MKKTFSRFLIGLFLVLTLVIFGASPVSAHATTSKAPVTVLKTNPNHAHSQDGWYTSVTMIELHANNNKIYFQMNSTDGKWQTYKKPIKAWRGENTLYYYSVNAKGEKEQIKSKVIKVDYIKSKIKNLKSVSKASGVQISTIKKTEPVATISNSKPVVNNVSPVSNLKKKAIDNAAKTEKISNNPEPEKTPAPVSRPARNWNHLLVAISILIIATGAAIGGYYGYEAWSSKPKEIAEKPKEKEKKSSSRW